MMFRLPLLATVTALVLGVGAAAARDTVEVRFGDHAGYSRTVFDWPGKVGYRVEER